MTNLKSSKKDTRRITLTISTELYDLFNILSDLNGKSMSYLPSYVLEESKSTFDSLIKAYSAAKTDKAKAMDIMIETAEQKMVYVAGQITRD